MDIQFIGDFHVSINGHDFSGAAISGMFRLSDGIDAASFESGSAAAKFCRLELAGDQPFFGLGDYVDNESKFSNGDGWAKFSLGTRPLPVLAVIGLKKHSALNYRASVTTLELTGQRVGDTARTHIAMRLKPAVG